MKCLNHLMVGVVLMGLALPATAQSSDVNCDVIVYGDSLGGVGAAVASARNGADTCLLANIGYAGGQATAAGVSTMDEGSATLRESGLYAELVNALEQQFGESILGTAYFGQFTGDKTLGPDPLSVKRILDEWILASGVRVFPLVSAQSVLHDSSNQPSGILGSDGTRYFGLIIDASETQDLFPMVSDLQYTAGDGSCLQDMTWTVVMRWYEDGIPDNLWVPVNLGHQLAKIYGWGEVSTWIDEFEQVVSPNGIMASDRVWTDINNDVVLRFTDGYTGYRGVLDTDNPNGPGAPVVTRTGINWANDSALTISGLVDARQRQESYQRAQAKTYLFMWYVRHVLGETNWAIANDLGFETVERPFNNPLISDRVERHFPLIPYIREGRRLTLGQDHMRWEHLANDLRGIDQWSNSVLLGAYFTDTHNCDLSVNELSGDGLYDVPLGIFVPKLVNNFLVALPRAGDVDRAVASSLRMQPTELNGGQVVGTLAAIAKEKGIEPNQVTADIVRERLMSNGVIVDIH